MEIIAVYQESRIKTYGFQMLSHLAMIELSCPFSEIITLGKIFTQGRYKAVRPKFMIAQESEHESSFIFCLPIQESKDFHTYLKRTSLLSVHQYSEPVGIIFFQGPHFGDRYGIASAIFSALHKTRINILASGFSLSSAYLVLGQDDMGRAEDMLTQTFDIAR